MQQFQTDFLEFVIQHQILRFGEFKLKSGRVSPYFFNAGLFNTGKKLSFLAGCYASAITESNLQFDVIFGPAYKGIPLAAATAMALANQHGIDKPYCFNRKEAKDHGEGGTIVGADLKGRALIIDDVITAGTAVKEAVTILSGQGAELAGIAIAMDRQERGAGTLSAIQEIEQSFHIKVVSIIDLASIMHYLQESDDANLMRHLDAISKYREEFGLA